MSDKTMVFVLCECIIRMNDNRLGWVGSPNDPMAKAVERCNEGKATEVDLLALSAFPVFDEDAQETTAIEIL